ncbi:MAG: hypothetical protein M1825_003694 [Sarcosagium campestre]|nr:MAG: hypothetical protein M1825_003694 [Sarcosagium campestre]
MPSRLPFRRKVLPVIVPCSHNILTITSCRRHAATAAAAITTTPAAPILQQSSSSIPRPAVQRYPPTQPPSYKRPEVRKSQLLRQYTSLLRSTPLMLIFQHNNLTSPEWVGLRRELKIALRGVDAARAASVAQNPDTPAPIPIADAVRVQVIQGSIFETALKIIEYHQPGAIREAQGSEAQSEVLTHDLSSTAHAAILKHRRRKHALQPLLSGPLAAVTFPEVSPAHVKCALSILSPSPPDFPAPTRRANPGYHDINVQRGVQKLLLLGARVERGGRVLDRDGAQWVGRLDAGGLDALRAQLLALLHSVAAGVTSTLESASQSLHLTLEQRRRGLMQEEPGKTEETSSNKTGSETVDAGEVKSHA